jgi:hypothetical protein
MKDLKLTQLNPTEMSEINGGSSDDFWNTIFDYFGVPEEYRIF